MEEDKLNAGDVQFNVVHKPIHIKKKKKKKLKKVKKKIEEKLQELKDTQGSSIWGVCTQSCWKYLFMMIFGIGIGIYFGGVLTGMKSPQAANLNIPSLAPSVRTTSHGAVERARPEDVTRGPTEPPPLPEEIAAGPETVTRGPTEPPPLEDDPIGKELNYDAIIRKILDKMQEMCDQWPYNYECYLLKRAANPKVEPREEDGMTRLGKMFVRKILIGERDVNYIGTGTSHSAAHDTLFGYNLWWATQRLVEDSFSLLGMNFTAHPRGVGSVGQIPRQAYCVDAIYGDKADIVSTDGFFGFDACDQERFLRYNLMQERQPVYIEIQMCGPCGLDNAWQNVYFQKHKPWDLEERPWDLIPQAFDTGRTPGKGLYKFQKHELFLNDTWLAEELKVVNPKLWSEPGRLEQAYQYWSEYVEAANENEKIVKLKDKDKVREEKKPGMLAQKYQKISIDSGNVARSADWHGFYLARSAYFRAGTHHPGPIAHYYHASQIAYTILTALVEAVRMIKYSKDIDALKAKAVKRIELPESNNPNCKYPADSGEQLCYMTTQPREPGHELEKLVIQGNYKLKEHIGVRGHGEHLDKHYEMYFKSSTDNEFLIFKVEVPARLSGNHDTKEVWLSFFDKSFNPELTKMWIDGEEVDFSDMDDRRYGALPYKNKAHRFEIKDRRPSMIDEAGHTWVVKPVSIGEHEIKFRGEVLIRQLWFL